MEKPRFKVGETVITRGTERGSRSRQSFYQTEECAPNEPWQESELRKVTQARGTKIRGSIRAKRNYL
jgi:hypothetical protein